MSLLPNFKHLSVAIAFSTNNRSFADITGNVKSASIGIQVSENLSKEELYHLHFATLLGYFLFTLISGEVFLSLDGSKLVISITDIRGLINVSKPETD